MKRWMPAYTFLAGLFVGVLVDLPPTPSTSHSNRSSEEATTRVLVLATKLNVREQPSTSAKILVTMTRGDTIRAIKKQGEWTQIHASRGTAWVYSSLVGSARELKRIKAKEEKQRKEIADKKYHKERAAAAKQKKLKEEAYKQKRADHKVALFKQWSEQIEYGCRSRAAVFKKVWLGGWQLTLTSYPNAHAEPIEAIFPNDYNKVKRTLEEIGAGDPVPYATYLKHIRACE